MKKTTSLLILILLCLQSVFAQQKKSLKLENIGLDAYINSVPTQISGYKAYLAGKKMILNGFISNEGDNVIQNFEIMANNGDEVKTETFTINIEPNDKKRFQFKNRFTIHEGANEVFLKITKINGQPTDKKSGHVAKTGIIGLNKTQLQKIVVVEESAGTWCGYSPKSYTMMDYMAYMYPENFIPIAVHNSDPMSVPAYDKVIETLVKTPPSTLVNRKYIDADPLEMEKNFYNLMLEESIANVAHTAYFDPETRQLTVNSSAKFNTACKGNLRFSLVLTENGIAGMGEEYDQMNHYSGGKLGKMGGYELASNPIRTENKPAYNYVARVLAGDFEGKIGSVPSKNQEGSTANYTFRLPLPDFCKLENTQAVTLLIDNATGEIVNAFKSPIVIKKEVNERQGISEVLSLKISPNPADDYTQININGIKTDKISIQIFDLSGTLVQSKNLNAGNDIMQNVTLDTHNLVSGNYIVKVFDGRTSMADNLSVVHEK